MSKDFAITIRFQVTDTQLFEDYLIFFKTWMEEEPSRYSYSIEWDDTINRHIHAVVTANYVDGDKLKRRITTKEFLPIIKKLKASNTILANAIKCSVVTKTPKKALGYTQKWHCNRRGHKGYTDQEIVDSVEYYYTTTRLEKTQEIKDDWILLNTKNFHAHVEDFIQKNPELKYEDSDIIKLRMVKHGYSFMSITSKQLEVGFREIRIKNDSSHVNDEAITKQEAYGLEKSFDDYLLEDIKDLFKFVESNKSKLEIPSSIHYMYQKYHDLS